MKFLLSIAAALVCSTALAAAPPVALDIRVVSGGAPFTTRARITVEPNLANRLLCLSWTQIQGGSQQRTSCQSIAPVVKDDGTTIFPPSTYWQFLKDLSSGKWSVVAFVRLNDDTLRSSTPITLHVLGPNYESE